MTKEEKKLRKTWQLLPKNGKNIPVGKWVKALMDGYPGDPPKHALDAAEKKMLALRAEIEAARPEGFINNAGR